MDFLRASRLCVEFYIARNIDLNHVLVLLGGIDPILRLLVLGVIYLLRGIDGGVKVFQDAPRLFRFAINQQVIAARHKTIFVRSYEKDERNVVWTARRSEDILACLC